MWGLGPNAEEVAITEPDFAPIAKRSYSAFYATDLEVELRRRGRDQLIIVGVFASAGILATTFDASARDIECFVGVEAIADYTAHQHRTALKLIASLTGRVASIQNLLPDPRGWAARLASAMWVGCALWQQTYPQPIVPKIEKCCAAAVYDQRTVTSFVAQGIEQPSPKG